MAYQVGDQNNLGFFYESGTYGTASGPLHWIGQIEEHTIDENENIIPVRYLGGGNRNVDDWVAGPRDYTGTIRFKPQDWKSLMFTLGSNVDSGSPSPYIHTISETNSDNSNAFTSGTGAPFISFGLEDAQETTSAGLHFVRTVKGATVDSLTINASEGEIITVDMNYVAQSVDFSSGAKGALTADTSRPFLWSDVQIHLPSGTNVDEVKSANFSINNNLVAPHYLNGSRVIANPIPTNRDYELSMTINANSTWTKTLYDQHFQGGSEFNMLYVVDAVADAGAGSRELVITLSGCRIIDMESPSQMEGENQQTITIRPQTAVALVNDTTELYNPW